MTETMNESEGAALIAFGLMAVHAKGEKGDREHVELKRSIRGLDAPRPSLWQRASRTSRSRRPFGTWRKGGRRIKRQHTKGRLADWTKEAGLPDGHSRAVTNGVPLDLRLQESRTGRVDLLDLGITGDSLLPCGTGTVSTECLRTSATEVLLVKQTHPRPFRRIVACVDFSETSNVVVKHALRAASQDMAELHLLHVFQAEWNNWSSRAQLAALANFEKSCRAILENNLRQFAAVPSETPALYSVTQAKTHGQGVVEFCRSMDADLIVLGARGQTKRKCILLGSTVARLLREPPCSVLVVRPPEAAAGTSPAGSAGK